MEGRPIFNRPLPELLEGIAGAGMEIGASSMSAMIVAGAAALLERVARRSGARWHEAPGAIAQARALRARAVPLVEASADAYGNAVAALSAHSSSGGGGPGQALSSAADVPLTVAQAGADVSLLAAEVAHRADADHREDAIAAALMAQAATRAAARLVEVNLVTSEGDTRLGDAREAVGCAADGCERAQQAPT